jgi:hypothetical protein
MARSVAYVSVSIYLSITFEAEGMRGERNLSSVSVITTTVRLSVTPLVCTVPARTQQQAASVCSMLQQCHLISKYGAVTISSLQFYSAVTMSSLQFKGRCNSTITSVQREL